MKLKLLALALCAVFGTTMFVSAQDTMKPMKQDSMKQDSMKKTSKSKHKMKRHHRKMRHHHRHHQKMMKPTK